MFCLKVYPSPEYFPQPLVAMLVTFRMSASDQLCPDAGVDLTSLNIPTKWQLKLMKSLSPGSWFCDNIQF